MWVLLVFTLCPLLLSRPQPRRTAKRKSIRFLPFGTRGSIRVCFFFVFSFRGPSARCSFFLGAKSLLLSCASLRVPCYLFWAEHVFLAFFFGAGDLQFCEARRLGLVRPLGPSWCLVTRSFGEPPTAGRQRVFSWGASLLSSSHTWETRCGLPLRGRRGRGQSVRASVLLSRVLTEAGVTPAVHLRGPAPSAANPTQPVRESGKVLAELAVSRGRGGQTPMPVS